jgi:hypothetical protein
VLELNGWRAARRWERGALVYLAYEDPEGGIPTEYPGVVIAVAPDSGCLTIDFGGVPREVEAGVDPADRDLRPRSAEDAAGMEVALARGLLGPEPEGNNSPPPAPPPPPPLPPTPNSVALAASSAVTAPAECISAPTTQAARDRSATHTKTQKRGLALVPASQPSLVTAAATTVPAADHPVPPKLGTRLLVQFSHDKNNSQRFAGAMIVNLDADDSQS